MHIIIGYNGTHDLARLPPHAMRTRAVRICVVCMRVCVSFNFSRHCRLSSNNPVCGIPFRATALPLKHSGAHTCVCFKYVLFIYSAVHIHVCAVSASLDRDARFLRRNNNFTFVVWVFIDTIDMCGIYYNVRKCGAMSVFVGVIQYSNRLLYVCIYFPKYKQRTLCVTVNNYQTPMSVSAERRGACCVAI